VIITHTAFKGLHASAPFGQNRQPCADTQELKGDPKLAKAWQLPRKRWCDSPYIMIYE